MESTIATENLNDLLQGEIAAVETYTQAVRTLDKEDREVLDQIKWDHIDACNMLRKYIHIQQETPRHDSGAWGDWSKFVEGAAKIVGRTPALKALKEGEEHGIKLYQKSLGDENLTPQFKRLVNDAMIPQGRRHIDALSRLMHQF